MLEQLVGWRASVVMLTAADILLEGNTLKDGIVEELRCGQIRAPDMSTVRRARSRLDLASLWCGRFEHQRSNNRRVISIGVDPSDQGGASIMACRGDLLTSPRTYTSSQVLNMNVNACSSRPRY